MINNKIKLKGHESFSIREGWLTKGIFEVREDERLFLRKDLTDVLGMGSNMVKSLKFWLISSGLIEETKKYEYSLTELGNMIYKFDPYFENIFSLYLVHFNLVTNIEKNYIWNVFFNKCNMNVFTKKDLLENIKYILDFENLEYNEKMLLDEISVLLKTYTKEEKNDTPENNFQCPLTELKLIRKKEKDVFVKEKPLITNLNKYIVYYAFLNQLGSRNSINIQDIMIEENSVCKLLNLDKVLLNEYLETFRKEKLITINRTAGLNMIYVDKKMKLEDIFNLYYERSR